MTHEWLAKPKKRRGKNQEQEPKTLFRQISNKELRELYNRIGFDPEAEHKPHNPPPQTIHNALEEDKKPKEDVKTELVENRPKVKAVVSDVLTDSGIS